MDGETNTPSDVEPIFKPLEAYKITSLPSSAYYIPNFLTPHESSSLLHSISKNQWTQLSHRRLQPHPAPLTPSGHLLTSKSLAPYLERPIVDRILSLSFSDDPSDISNNNNNNENSNKNINTRDDVVSYNIKEGRKRRIFTSSPHHRPNHVLINEYPPGTGIPSHQDGAAYFPVVCTVTLSSHTVLEITPKQVTDSTTTNENNENTAECNDGVKYKIYQEPLSLLITTDEIYTSHLHGISATTTDENLSPSTINNWNLLSDDTRNMIQAGEGKVERTETRVSLTYRDVLKVTDAGKVFGGRGFKFR
ncbi:hypothetical protein TWF694_006142 [Orbilia ellipsospora]|uniref:Fe2OG dioxygenase domain-containing protein n=1 Tax=Orbilia ellipsospora TaxID=2528407 RepID=A0AAV9WRK4_9PEZI